MKRIAITLMLLALGGCGLADVAKGPDIHVIEQCATQNPPPPQAKVGMLGLLTVYLTHTAASDDDATRKWYADMDACTARPKLPESDK